MDPSPRIRPPGPDRVNQIVKDFEHIVVLSLMALLMVVVGLCTFELGWLLVRDLSTRTVLLLDVDEIFELFGFFLLVLIGMELLVTLKAFLYDRVIHVEVVLEVALIAFAQKTIVLNTSRTQATTLFSLAALLLSLALAYWVVRSARGQPSS